MLNRGGAIGANDDKIVIGGGATGTIDDKVARRARAQPNA